MKASEQHFPVVACGTVCYAVQGGSNFFWVCRWNSKVRSFKLKLLSCIFSVVLFIVLCTMVLSFESVKEVLKCNHWNETSWTVLSPGFICISGFWKKIEICLFFLELWLLPNQQWRLKIIHNGGSPALKELVGEGGGGSLSNPKQSIWKGST